jgi:hypothetical protein
MNMKRELMHVVAFVSVMVAGFLWVACARAEPDPIQVSVNPDTQEAFVGVDMLAGRNAQGQREQGRIAAIGGWVRENPWKTAGIVAAGVVGVRAATGDLQGDIDRVRGKGRNRDGGAGRDLIGDDVATATAIANSIQGNGNVITQTIIIQQPQGSGVGMQGNTGAGGQGNAMPPPIAPEGF